MVMCKVCEKESAGLKLLMQHANGCNYLDYLTIEEIALINSCKMTLKNNKSNILNIIKQYK